MHESYCRTQDGAAARTPLIQPSSEASTKRNLLLSIAFATTALTAAHATSVPGSVYDFTGKTTTGSVGTGTVTTNSNGDVTGGNISFSGGFLNQTSFFVEHSESAKSGDLGLVFINISDFSHGQLYLKGQLVGSTVDACIASACQFNNGSYTTTFTSEFHGDALVSGKLTLEGPAGVTTATTPEPSSLILLGTGALSMAGAVRRRFFPRA